MSDTKFTPGPWSVQSPNSDTCHYEIVQAFVNGDVVAGEYGIENEHDANLMAYSREMFDLIELVHKSFGGGNIITFSDYQIEEFSRVYDKARGGS